MSGPAETSRRVSSRRGTASGATCPSCQSPLKPDAERCPACHFTGGDSMTMFSGPPPQLLPILDAAEILKESELRKIGVAHDRLRRRFPQFQWRICTVRMPRETSLPLLGFWLLNACPLSENETAGQRAWTVLLVVNADTGQAAAVPGYAAEHHLSDDGWRAVIATMAGPWRSGKPADAIVRFFESSGTHLKQAWKRRPNRTPS